MMIFVAHINFDYNQTAEVFTSLRGARQQMVDWFNEGRDEEIDTRLPWRKVEKAINEAASDTAWKGNEIEVFELVGGAWRRRVAAAKAEPDMILDAEGAAAAVRAAASGGAVIARGERGWHVEGRMEVFDSDVEAAIGWLDGREDEELDAEAA